MKRGENGESNQTPQAIKSKSESRIKGKRWKKNAAIVLLSILFVAFAAGAGVFFYFKNIMNNPEGQFTKPSASATQEVDEYGNLISQADFSTMKNVVNILIVGLDYSEDRNGWPLKDTYNADVMMILAVDFNNNKVDMISLPRDSYVKMPNAKGIYKLNAAMKCGGGYPKGFPKVMEAAKWMLGGIPVDYYYGVTMPVVKDLVNAIGGVDYELDIDFTINGRSYTKGIQHMDGQAVLDYFRVRKNVEDPGDLNRINRQKKMLLAIFKKMQQQNQWVKVLGILNSVSNKVVTNTTLGQTAALASFAYNLKEENIKMYSMGGTMASVFNYNFCITDQTARVALIKEVYGVSVSAYKDYGYDAVMKKWGGMMYEVYQPNAVTLINHVQGLINNGTVPTPSPTVSPKPTPSPTVSFKPMPSSSPHPSPNTSATFTPSTSSGSVQHASLTTTYDIYEKFLEVKTLYAKAKSLQGEGKKLVDALNELKIACRNLASKVNHPLKDDDLWKIEYDNQYDVY